jgi:hypothetical protein
MNPYQSPAVPSGKAVTPDELSALGPLRQAILTLRIIVVALALGVLVFGAITIAHNLGQPQSLGGKLDVVALAMLGFGLLCGAQGIVLPGILFRFVARPNPALLSQFAQHGPEVARILTIQSRIQTATIVGCACFEGGAFANLVWYMNSGELAHLALAGLMLLGILARFPLPGACERRIADELRRQNEEASLKPPAIDRSRAG